MKLAKYELEKLKKITGSPDETAICKDYQNGHNLLHVARKHNKSRAKTKEILLAHNIKIRTQHETLKLQKGKKLCQI